MAAGLRVSRPSQHTSHGTAGHGSVTGATGCAVVHGNIHGTAHGPARVTGAIGSANVRAGVHGIAHGPPSALGPAARCQPVSQHPSKVATWASFEGRGDVTGELAEGVSVGAASHTADVTAGVWVRCADVGGGHSGGISAAVMQDGLVREERQFVVRRRG